jgi:alkylated DNA repair dioxygenase AlkB
MESMAGLETVQLEIVSLETVPLETVPLETVPLETVPLETVPLETVPLEETIHHVIQDLPDIGSGDCKYIDSILSDLEKETMFYTIKNEMKWHEMNLKGNCVPRLVNIQSEVYTTDSGKTMYPLYRHPVDEHPVQIEFTPMVRILKDRAEDVLEVERGYFNHCLVQLYSGGGSFINDHSDKTLDIAKDTCIVNLSLGAVRYMRIKNKNKERKESKKIKLENGSLFVLGLETNKNFFHGIKQDNRDVKLKNRDETDFNCERISLTFRNIATFIDSDKKMIGQGARKGPQLDSIQDTTKMMYAFGRENKNTNFNWEKEYGCGFDSIDLKQMMINPTEPQKN